MAKAKEKTKTVTIYNYAKSDLAPAIASIAKKQNELAELQRVADLSIAKIQTDLAANIAPLIEEIQKISLSIRDYSDKNREDLFPEEFKTLKLETGDISYRAGGTSVDATNSVKLINGILQKNNLLVAKDRFEIRLEKAFLRMKLEINKDAIKENPDKAKELTGIGLKTSPEGFYIKPYSTNTEIEVVS